MPGRTATRKLALRYLDTVGFIADQGGRGFHLPTAIAISSEGKIYVANRSSTEATRCVGVGIVTLDHQYFGHFASYGSGDGQFIWPTSMAFDSQDRLYLADEYTHRINIYDKAGKFLSRWGVHGSGDGQLDAPSGLAFDREDNLYVVDHRNHRIQKFTRDGKFLMKFGSHGSGPGQLNLPWGIAVGHDGNVYVADWRNDRIQKFSPDGRSLASFGRSGRGDGEFHRPSGVAVDREGYIYVADWGNQRVQVLGPDGSFQLKLRGQATLSPWAREYLEANADELAARAKYVPVIQLDTDDPHEVSARTESYFWDPVAVVLDRQERLYVLEVNRHRFQVYQKA